MDYASSVMIQKAPKKIYIWFSHMYWLFLVGCLIRVVYNSVPSLNLFLSGGNDAEWRRFQTTKTKVARFLVVKTWNLTVKKLLVVFSWSEKHSKVPKFPLERDNWRVNVAVTSPTKRPF